ncbi:TPA: hypothetical protein DDW35_06280 [Candidatus Sumerlaeota bacterium]|nr:hypothetical protein [Candidatus Sumerlaeota bacterium]
MALYSRWISDIENFILVTQMQGKMEIADLDISTWPGPVRVPGLVSVIIPVRDRATLLPLTLDSIWMQSHRGLEIIVVDDGSEDGTPEAVEKWVAGHASDLQFSVRVLRCSHRGLSATRNTGTVEAGGEFIQYFDSDDLMRPEKLAKSLAVLRAKPDLDFVACDHIQFRERNGKILYNQEHGAFSKLDHTAAGYLQCGGVLPNCPLFHRQSLTRVGPWKEDLLISEDLEYFFRVLTLLRGEWLPEVLYDMRATPYSLSSGERRKKKEYWDGYLEACRDVEAAAHKLGVLQKPVRQALGYRLRRYAIYLAKKRQWDSYDMVGAAALARLGWRLRVPLLLHRGWFRFRGKYRPSLDCKKLNT